MAKKKGPPYEDDPECQYVVIDTPWPGDQAGSAREPRYFNMVAVWLSYMLSPRVWPEELYYVSTRAEIIARYPQGVHISPIFGEHPWRDFLTRKAADVSSCIFPYNYRRLGHPAEHNWSTHIPAGDPPPYLGLGPPPFRHPWPPALYAEPLRKACRSLALPMPMPEIDQKEDIKPATPPPAEDENERPAHYALAHHLPDEPLPEAEDLPEEKQEPLQPPPERLFVNKLDPYDEDDAAAIFLKAETQDVALPPVKAEVKQEDIPPEPSAELVNAVRRWKATHQQGQDQGQDAIQTASVVKEEPNVPTNAIKPEPEAEALQASAALIAAIEGHRAREREQAQAEEEKARLAAKSQHSQGAVDFTAFVKPEPQEGMLPPASSNGRHIKREPQEVSTYMSTRDTGRPASSSSKRVKQEDTDPRSAQQYKRSRR